MRRAYDAFGDAEFRARRSAMADAAAGGVAPGVVPTPMSAKHYRATHLRRKADDTGSTATTTATAAAAAATGQSETPTATAAAAMQRQRQQQQQQQQQSTTVIQAVTVALEIMYRGCTLPLTYDRLVRCRKCQGTGSARLVICIECGGSGNSNSFIAASSAMPQPALQCRMCGGEGSIALPQEKCSECIGRKVVPDSGLVSVVLEAGVPHGHKLHFPGCGNYLPGRKSFGELVVVVNMAEHALFRRSGADLAIDARISLREALCGYVLRVPHPSGREIVLRSPPGKVTRPGDVLVVEGQGMPVFGSNGQSFGRLAVRLQVEFPKDNAFTEESIAALEALLPNDSLPHFISNHPQPPIPPQEEQIPHPQQKRSHDEVSITP